MNTTRLDDSTATRLLRTAIANIQRDHPVHWTHFVEDDSQLVPQRVLHPVFAGSFDWHSCVHQTWLAARLLRLRPWLEGADEARSVLDRLITADGCAVEAAFFASPAGRYWERPYGWAWLLLLDAELRTGELPWSVAPIASVLRDRYLEWVSAARLPVRTGTHSNTAFATCLVFDAASAVGDVELASACSAAALRWHREDAGYGGFEPDAADFLSPALNTADLMRRALEPADFATWFERFLPSLDDARWKGLREPFPVDDPSDAYGSHLAGLALSRAWNWKAIASALPAEHRNAELAATAASLHREAGWRYVFGHGYMADHWLGTFAAYLDVGALQPQPKNTSASA
jgi:hypothetical protein